jgi:transcriptional regulator with XRE-family HTH domain
VNAAEMWTAVGKFFRRVRVDRNWSAQDVERAGGPSYKTVLAIEAGKVGTVKRLDEYADALDLELVDILLDILASNLKTLSPEAAQVVRKFTRTTVEGRTAIVAITNALPDAESPEPASPGAAAPVTPRPPRPGPAAAKRRTAR